MAKIKMPDQRKIASGLAHGHDPKDCGMAQMIARINLEKEVSPNCHKFIEVQSCKQQEVEHFVTAMATISKDASKDAKCPAKDRAKMATGHGLHEEDETNACMMARLSARINLEKMVSEGCHKHIVISSCKKH